MKIKSILPQTKVFLRDDVNIPIINIKETHSTDLRVEPTKYNSISLYQLDYSQSINNSAVKLKDYNYMMNIDVSSVSIKTIMSFESSLIYEIIKKFMGVSSIDNSQKEELYFDGASEFMHTIFGLAIPKYMNDGESIKTYPPKQIDSLEDIDMPEKYSILQEVIHTKYGNMSIYAIESENKHKIDQKTVLVVDDSLMIISKMKLFLNDLGHNVLTASNGQDAIKIYEEEKPDFVTMDVNMPKMNGLEALKYIIQIDSDAKVIMITSDGQESIMMQSFKEGALDYVLKPITIEKLQKVISTIYVND